MIDELFDRMARDVNAYDLAILRAHEARRRPAGNAPLKTLAEAVASVPPPPCDDCRHARRCADDKLSCQVLNHYVAHGRFQGAEARGHIKRVPSAAKYRDMFLGSERRGRPRKSTGELPQYDPNELTAFLAECRDYLRRAPVDQFPMANMARAMGLAESTVSRRLRAARVAYPSLLDAERQRRLTALLFEGLLYGVHTLHANGLAKRLGLSPPVFRRKFAEWHGITFQDWKTERGGNNAK